MLDNRNKLYSATNSIHYELVANVFDLTMRNQCRYCSYSLQSVLIFEQGISMTDEEKKQALHKCEKVEQIRFIQLTLKNTLMTNYYTCYSHIKLPPNCIRINNDKHFSSTLVKVSHPNML